VRRCIIRENITIMTHNQLNKPAKSKQDKGTNFFFTIQKSSNDTIKLKMKMTFIQDFL
jgi:hypothetical protein